MADSSFEINAELREETGKAYSRRLRRLEDKIPAVVYGAHKKPSALVLNHKEVIKLLENEAFFSHILNLKVAGKKTGEKVVLKDVQRHAYKPKVLHMDFLRVSAKEKITMTVPLHFLNEESAPGIKEEGGIASHNITEVEISCLPADLPEFIAVDAGSLNLGDSLHLSDIKLPSGVELTAFMHGDNETHDDTVVSIQAPQVEKEPEEAETLEASGEKAESADSADDTDAEEKPSEE